MTANPRLRPLALSLISALLLWCAFPGGGGLWPLLAIALVPLLVALPLMGAGQAALTAFAAGICHFLLSLYWIVTVLGRYGGLPVFITVPALVLLAAYMAVYIAGFAVAARLLLNSVSPLPALFGIPALWVGMEWLRAQLFTGFPWMDIGYGLGDAPRLIQLADLFGHGGISFLIILVNSLLALTILRRKLLRSLVIPAVAVLVVLIPAGVYSYLRWQAVADELTDSAAHSMLMGVVQGNIDQSEKWSPENQQATLTTYLRNSQSLFVEQHPDLLVWPETALPFYPQDYSDLGVLHGLVAQYDTALLTGAPWYEVVDRGSRDFRYFNSAQLLEPGGSFAASYYKSHLVPFGEYVPLKKLLPFLAPLVEAVGDFSPGSVGQPLEWRGARIGVLICFESIFPELGRKWSENGANVLVNLTNDAWYGKSSAPYQSMAMTVFRAVETRRSVVRSANTGISGFIDPLGRVKEPSPIFTIWADAERVVLMAGQTVFVRWGYLFPPACLIMGLLLTGAAVLRARNTLYWRRVAENPVT